MRKNSFVGEIKRNTRALAALVAVSATLVFATSSSGQSVQGGCANFHMEELIPPAEFKEYAWYESVAYGSEEGRNDDGSEWETWPKGGTLEDVQAIRFSVFEFSSSPLWNLFDSANRFASAGVLKFVIPPPPCDAIVEWDIFPQIDLMHGATAQGDYAWVDIDFVASEQPTSTEFPPGDDTIQFWGSFQQLGLGISYTEADGRNVERRVERRRLKGSFRVKKGISSSVFVGVSVYIAVEDGEACIGDCGTAGEDVGWFEMSDRFPPVGTPSPLSSRIRLTYVMRSDE